MKYYVLQEKKKHCNNMYILCYYHVLLVFLYSVAYGVATIHL